MSGLRVCTHCAGARIAFRVAYETGGGFLVAVDREQVESAMEFQIGSYGL